MGNGREVRGSGVKRERDTGWWAGGTLGGAAATGGAAGGVAAMGVEVGSGRSDGKVAVGAGGFG